MKVTWREWPSLMKAPLKPFYWISGDDPLLTEEALQSLRLAAKQQGFERETMSLNQAQDWQQFSAQRQNFSLFSPKPFYECQMSESKFKEGIQAQLQACAQTPPGSACIVLTTPKLEASTQKTKWFEALLPHMVWLPLWPLEGEAFNQYMQTLAQQAGVQFTRDAWSLFTTHCTELLSAKQTLMRLASLPASLIDVTVLQEYLPDTLPCEVFDLADAALRGDVTQTVRYFYQLNNDSDVNVLILWSLTRDIDTLLALKAQQDPAIFPKRKPWFMKALHRFNEQGLNTLLKQCALLDRALKGGAEGAFAPDQLIDVYVRFAKGESGNLLNTAARGTTL